MRDVRTDLVSLMRATLADNDAHHTWTYRAVRPCPVPASWMPGQRVWGDCSKAMQMLLRWAGGPDPMANNWDVWGNSQTLWMNLQHRPFASDLLPGDIVTSGWDGRDHAAMVLEDGPDPLMWSFGHQGSPDLYRLSRDRRPKQFLRVPIPAYVPTPGDKLRARTDWFAWCAWRLGEGDWKAWGKANPKVRPNVPTNIALQRPLWWPRFWRFLANRKQANKGTGDLRLGLNPNERDT